jgi:hypothetical protein
MRVEEPAAPRLTPTDVLATCPEVSGMCIGQLERMG